MLVETHFPRRLSPSRYDSFLAAGWFRGSLMLYKMDLLCVDETLYSVVNIRINLMQHVMSKRQRKLLRRNAKRYSVELGKVQITPEKERLYELHKPRFKGYVHDSLADYLSQGAAGQIFDTREMRIYEGETLVAVSFFDVGHGSLASLLGLHDPAHASASLGTYTLLQEMIWGQQNGFKWFYPGYVMDRPSDFDYKLRLGDIEYYTPTKRWGKWMRYDREKTNAAWIEREMMGLEAQLSACGVSCRSWLYPYFTLGNLPFVHIDFLNLPWFFEIGHDLDGMLIVGFSPLSGGFVLAHILPCPNEFPQASLEFASEYDNSEAYWNALMKFGDIRMNPASASDVVAFVTGWQHRFDAIAHTA